MTETEKLLTALADRERLLRQERAAAEQAGTLLKAMDFLHASEVPEEGIRKVLEISQQATGSDLAILMRADDDGNMATRLVTEPSFGLPHWKIPAKDLAHARRVTDLWETPLKSGVPTGAAHFRSLLSVPVAPQNERLMVLTLLSQRRAKYTRHDLGLMRRIAAMLESAVDRLGLAHHTAALARIVDHITKAEKPPLFPDSPFETLNRAFKHLVDWQGQIVDITNQLLSDRRGSSDFAVERALARTGQLAGADRTYVFRLRPPDRLDNTHEWVATGIDPMIEQLQDMPADLLDEWRPELEDGRSVTIPDIDALPKDSAVKPVLQMQGIRSLLAVPMLEAGQLAGFVGYDAVRAHRRFLPAEIQLLQSVANAISVVLARTAAETAARDALARAQRERDRSDATLAAIPDLVLEFDQDGCLSGYAPGALVQPAFSPEDALGRSPEKFLPPHLASLAREIMHQVDRRGHASGYEYDLEVSDELRWFEVSAAATPETGRQTGGYVFIVRDITESRQQRQQIRRLGRIAELTSNLVVVTDADGRIDWVNPAFEARSGWRLDEVRGKMPGHFLQSDKTDRATVHRIRSAVRQGRPVQAELLNRARSGEEYWISKDIQPLHDDSGRLDGFIAVQTDITELKKSHQRALQLRGQAMDGSRDGIGITDATGAYRYMNPAHRRMFGIGLDEDISQFRWQDIYTEEERKRITQDVMPILMAEGSWNGNTQGIHRDGSKVEQDVTLSLTADGGVLCITRDISKERALEAERTQLREELQLAQRRETVAHLSAGVAHDLNNLVAVVSGTVSLLEEQAEGSSGLSTGLRRIGRAMDAARELVAGLRDTTTPPEHKGILDLREVIREARDLLGSARASRHGIRVVAPDFEQPVWSNRTDLLQVALNLALNACEADSGGDSTVTLAIGPSASPPTARRPDVGEYVADAEYSFFAVSDTGDGIDPTLRGRLFERYVTTKGDSGTGLGLPIVAGILRESGGALWIDSEQGRGTTMTVAWPATSPRPNCPGVTANANGGIQTLSGKRILVVDDVADVAEVLTEMLKTDGAVPIAVSGSNEARELLQENPGFWSAVVTDLDMPGLSGADIASVAAKLDPPVPSVLVTAVPERAEPKRGMFHSVLPKPIEARLLVEKVRAAISATA